MADPCRVKKAIVEAFDELVAAMVVYEERLGREIELSVRADGMIALMVGDETAESFEQVAVFDDIEDLWAVLVMGPDQAVEAEVARG